MAKPFGSPIVAGSYLDDVTFAKQVTSGAVASVRVQLSCKLGPYQDADNTIDNVKRDVLAFTPSSVWRKGVDAEVAVKLVGGDSQSLKLVGDLAARGPKLVAFLLKSGFVISPEGFSPAALALKFSQAGIDIDSTAGHRGTHSSSMSDRDTYSALSKWTSFQKRRGLLGGDRSRWCDACHTDLTHELQFQAAMLRPDDDCDWDLCPSCFTARVSLFPFAISFTRADVPF